MIPRADHYRLPADRHRVAELVTCRRVRGNELLLLAPDSTVAHKDIGRALIAARRARSKRRADHYRLPTDRHRPAEVVTCRRVRGDELLLLGPDTAAAHKDIGRPLLAARSVSIKRRSDHHRIAADRH